MGTLTITASEQPKTEFEKFAEMFAPPADVRRTIESSSEWPHFGPIKGQKDSPDVYAKGDQIERPYNALLIRKVLNALQLDRLDMADKYVYQHNDKWGVAAVAIEQDTSSAAKYLSYEEVTQIIRFTETMCYMDFRWGANVFRDKKTGKITIVDTDNRGFGGRFKGSGKQSQENCVSHIRSYLLDDNDMDADSKALLRKRAQQLSQSKAGTKKRDFLREVGQKYNDTGIDFQDVKEEFFRKTMK